MTDKTEISVEIIKQHIKEVGHDYKIAISNLNKVTRPEAIALAREQGFYFGGQLDALQELIKPSLEEETTHD